MANLEFVKLNCSVILHCVSVDGEVKDLEDIKKDFQTCIKYALEDELMQRNNVVLFEISDGGDSRNGSGSGV